MFKYLLNAALFLGTLCCAYSHAEDVSASSEMPIIVPVDRLEDTFVDVSRIRISKRKIWFVNNTNTNTGDGSFKNPFNTLLAAQNASKKNDIIIVFPGDNTSNGMNQGFVMKKGQSLLGAGVAHEINAFGRKIVVPPASVSLPLITNAANGNGITLADRCTISGIHVISIMGGTAILGGDNNPAAPQALGIKNTTITRNLLSNMTVLNGTIYLPNCRGKLVIEENTIFNILGVGSKTGIEVVNQNVKVNSHVHIIKNTVSNNGNNGITVAHNSPSGVVKAIILENTVFNIGQAGDGYFIGTQGSSAGGKVFATVEKNFCQNSIGHDLNLQSSGTAHVVAKLKKNQFVVSTLVGVYAASNDSSRLCLNLSKNISDTGYSLNQLGSSLFRLTELRGNIGIPFTTSGTIEETPCHSHHSH